MKYLAEHPTAVREHLVSAGMILYHLVYSYKLYMQVKGVAEGLKYLHFKNVIHGDLHPVRFFPA